jgi:intracellular septation protein A
MVEPMTPELEEEPAAKPPLQDVFGGPRGVVDSIVPTVVFITVNAVRKDLKEASIAAVASGVVLVVLRLVRKEPLRHVFSGFLGVLISALVAMRLGKAEGFFIPGIVLNAVYFVVFLGSVLLGKPVLGFLLRQISAKPAAYHEHPQVRRAYAEATLGWTALFGLRVAVQGTLVLQGETTKAGITKVLLGPILYVALLAATLPYIARRTAGVPVHGGPSGPLAEPS